MEMTVTDNYQLSDIADDLIILNKKTIEKLCSLENAFDCIALYIFYYKTAKWQKTDIIKATDNYVIKSLKIGKARLNKTKQTLKENGLIEIVQRRADNKISGWYVKIHYITSESKNPQNELVENATSSKQDTNALREYIKCLKIEIEMLKGSKAEKECFDQNLFEKFWQAYPKKKSRGNAENWFKKNKPSEELVNLMIKKINLLKNTDDWRNLNGKYIPYPASWLNSKGWEDEVEVVKQYNPNWLNEDIKDVPATEEEIKEFEKKLGGIFNG